LKLLADENVPWPLVKKLTEKEVDVVWIPAANYRGLSDEEVVNTANAADRTILTRDQDFTEKPLRLKSKYGIYILQSL
jgi:predicted nuclease of predicted toxin-antitoxin system